MKEKIGLGDGTSVRLIERACLSELTLRFKSGDINPADAADQCGRAVENAN